MRLINELTARRANREGGATGRFWERRFKSIALLDEAAVAARMAYVDLNPVRPQMTERVEEVKHTSIRRRVRAARGDDAVLAPLSDLGLTLPDYRALLAWTPGIDRGAVDVPEGGATRALGCLGQGPDAWLGSVKAHRLKYRAYGALGLLHAYAEVMGQRWLCGMRAGLAAPG